jgi:hypothetical protein
VLAFTSGTVNQPVTNVLSTLVVISNLLGEHHFPAPPAGTLLQGDTVSLYWTGNDAAAASCSEMLKLTFAELEPPDSESRRLELSIISSAG